MTREQIEKCIMELGKVGIMLSQVEVKGEVNLDLLLSSIQTVRKVKNTLKEGTNDED